MLNAVSLPALFICLSLGGLRATLMLKLSSPPPIMTASPLYAQGLTCPAISLPPVAHAGCLLAVFLLACWPASFYLHDCVRLSLCHQADDALMSSLQVHSRYGVRARRTKKQTDQGPGCDLHVANYCSTGRLIMMAQDLGSRCMHAGHMRLFMVLQTVVPPAAWHLSGR